MQFVKNCTSMRIVRIRWGRSPCLEFGPEGPFQSRQYGCLTTILSVSVHSDEFLVTVQVPVGLSVAV